MKNVCQDTKPNAARDAGQKHPLTIAAEVAAGNLKVAQDYRAHLVQQKAELLNFVKQTQRALNLPEGGLRERRLWELRIATTDILRLYGEIE